MSAEDRVVKEAGRGHDRGSAALAVSAVTGMLAVLLGAFGAHGLKGVLEARDTLDVWRTAVFYHLAHAVVLLVLALVPPFRRGPWLCLLLGIVFFSGSLYVLALKPWGVLGPVTPLGGLLLAAGWLWLAGRRADGGRGKRED